MADRKRFLKASRSLFDLLRSDRNLLEWRRLGTLISLETFSGLGRGNRGAAR